MKTIDIHQKMLSLRLAISSGTFGNGLEATTFSTKPGTFSTRPGLESKPNPTGIDIERAGRASIVFDMTAVARLNNVTQN
jgi:hypothetical protein